MKVSKGQFQPETAAALVFPDMDLGRPLEYRVLIVTHATLTCLPQTRGPLFLEGSHIELLQR